MEQHQAEELARRAINLWRSTPPLDQWTATLTPLRFDLARTALNNLAAQHRTQLTIDEFTTAYRRAGGPRPTPNRCELCDDTGVNGQEYLIIGGERGETEGWAIEYPIPTPCRCTAGNRFPRTPPPEGVQYRYSPTPLERTPFTPEQHAAANAAARGAA